MQSLLTLDLAGFFNNASNNIRSNPMGTVKGIAVISAPALFKRATGIKSIKAFGPVKAL